MSLTNSLRNRDFDGFRRIAAGFLDQYGRDGVVVVADRGGRQVFSSVTTDTANLPPRNNREIVEKVFATRSPHYSNLFIGAVKQQLIVSVEVPVVHDGEVIYGISFSPPIGIFQDIVEKQRPSGDWTISIFDRDGINFARVPNPQDTIGKRASPTLFAAMFRTPEATLPTVSLEGVPLDHQFCALVADRLDRGRRHFRDFAGRPVVAQPCHHQRDRRRAAAGRPRLRGADGHHDRPRRDAARSPDRGAQSPRQEYAGDPAGDRDANLPQRQPRPSARNSKAGSARWRKRTIC